MPTVPKLSFVPTTSVGRSLAPTSCFLNNTENLPKNVGLDYRAEAQLRPNNSYAGWKIR